MPVSPSSRRRYPQPRAVLPSINIHTCPPTSARSSGSQRGTTLPFLTLSRRSLSLPMSYAFVSPCLSSPPSSNCSSTSTTSPQRSIPPSPRLGLAAFANGSSGTFETGLFSGCSERAPVTPRDCRRPSQPRSKTRLVSPLPLFAPHRSPPSAAGPVLSLPRFTHKTACPDASATRWHELRRPHGRGKICPELCVPALSELQPTLRSERASPQPHKRQPYATSRPTTSELPSAAPPLSLDLLPNPALR